MSGARTFGGRRWTRAASSAVSCLLLLVVVASCAEEEYPAWLWAEQHPAAPDAGGPPSAVENAIVCRQAQAQSLPARLVAMSANAASSGTVILESDIFQRFVSVCGTCHGPSVDQGQGGFQIKTATDFQTQMAAPPGQNSLLAHVTHSVCPAPPNMGDPNDPMPPCSSPNGGTYAMRPETDPVKQFAELVLAWNAAGSPSQFTEGATTPSGDAGTVSPFVMTPLAGNALTNLGNCVPSSLALVDDKVAALDAMFASAQAQPGGTAAQAIGLPEDLGDTDLFTLDSATLAQYGVIAYAPGYPLWSDDAGKLRYVRVPQGTSIHFNKATQQFEIPPNTRFYKTFMKPIVDTDGSYRYRKIETRLIVSRPDLNNPDGTALAQTALFGSYEWSADETKATLVETPLNSGEPFADTVLFYNTDEPLAAEVLAGQPTDPETTLVASHAARHYAIPGSPRCMQCHMGSPSQSFVLGFTPLQINRRPTGIGGTIEATGPDELTQLQRFIAAGIVTGIDAPADVLPLEQSQGTRTPRNDHELIAQGYMLGNCSHCHNPRGFPTIQNPVLANVLDFLPGPDGGVFQFPLERYSPRIGRGLTGTTPIPYLTPSLVDLPRQDPSTGSSAPDILVAGQGAGSPVSADLSHVNLVVYAPWRSIIYRNVDSAFAYVDDLALYPHMPMNTPGYDPRGKQILSDWMVSIPAVRKHPEIEEYAYQTSGVDNINSPVVDSTPQPYVEVSSGDPGYADALAAAQQRLDILHSGMNPAVALSSDTGAVYSRYADLLTGQTDDILDPAVVADPVCNPIPTNKNGSAIVSSPYPFPLHPDWVVTDLTQPPGAWGPRQANWPNVLVAQQPIPAPSTTCGTAPTATTGAYDDQLDAVSLLQDAALEQVSAFTTTPVPFGLWQTQSGCDFSSVPTVSSFQGAQRPHWMDLANPPANAPVYMETPGSAIFKMICINCHGPKADSNGRLAQNLATMTGGRAQVADWHDGLFGPAASPGADIAAQFGAEELPAADADAGFSGPSTTWTQATDDDRAARYMAWMGLGGTSVNIPPALLEIVAATKVLDQYRVVVASSLSANMLSQAKALCVSLLGPNDADAPFEANQPVQPSTPGTSGTHHGYLDATLTVPYLNNSLIFENGDAELWLSLCAIANPPPVHVLVPPAPPPGNAPGTLELDVTFPLFLGALNVQSNAPRALVAQDFYEAGLPIGNAGGGVESYRPTCASASDCPGAAETCDAATKTCTNAWPWCVDERDVAPNQLAWIQANGFPPCPPAVLSESTLCGTTCASGVCDPSCFETDAANRWAVRGAINAGFAIFQYAQSIETSGPAPDYNQCNLLPSALQPK